MNQQKHLLTAALILSCGVFFAACERLNKTGSDDNRPSAVGVTETGSPVRSGSAESPSVTPAKKPEPTPDASACTGLDTGEKAVLKSQTFPIDFAPFNDSCFVTMHDPDHTDPPLGSEIGIFKDGTQTYRFESAFSQANAACWVIAVGFRDINDDGLTDIVIAGKCGAKAGPVVTNEIQMNDGRGFYSKVASNDKLKNFTTVKEITDFARKNKQLFER